MGPMNIKYVLYGPGELGMITIKIIRRNKRRSVVPYDDELWRYCCEDTVRTWEVDEATAATIEKLGLQEVNAFQQDLFHCTLRTMALGIRLDTTAKAKMSKELAAEARKREEWLTAVFGHPVQVKSPKHLSKLFYEDLQQPIVLDRKTRRPTTKEEALDKIAKREPLLAPVVKKISELRSIGVFTSTFLDAQLDVDSRLRCSFNPCGTYTFRYSSSKNTIS